MELQEALQAAQTIRFKLCAVAKEHDDLLQRIDAIQSSMDDVVDLPRMTDFKTCSVADCRAPLRPFEYQDRDDVTQTAFACTSRTTYHAYHKCRRSNLWVVGCPRACAACRYQDLCWDVDGVSSNLVLEWNDLLVHLKR